MVAPGRDLVGDGRPPALLDPRQGDVGRNGVAPVKDALRSVILAQSR
jgi:hypothetical protein